MGKRKDGETSVASIAIVNKDCCKPSKCRQECKANCPVVRMGKKIKERIK